MNALNELPLKQEVESTRPEPDILTATTSSAVARAARNRRIWVNILRVLLIVILIGGWEIATTVQINKKPLLDSFFFGQPSGILTQLVTWVTEGTSQGPLWEQIAVTLEETVIGFGLGVIAGVICGIALGRVRILAEVFGPYINIANSIPRVVLGSIFTVVLGLGLASKVALAFVMVFFVVFFNAFQGVREVDRNLVANARILGASGWQVSRQVILPSALTWIIASLHTSFGFALVGAVVGEFLGSLKGLGNLIATAQGSFNPNGIFAAMFILAVVALIADGLIARLERRLIKWRPNRMNEVTV